MYHPAYGELLWYQNFNGEAVAKAAYANAAVGSYTFYSPNDAKSNFSFVNTDKGISLQAVPAMTYLAENDMEHFSAYYR